MFADMDTLLVTVIISSLLVGGFCFVIGHAIGRRLERASASMQVAELTARLERQRADAEVDRRAVEQLVRPVTERLDELSHCLTESERGRTATSAALSEQVRQLATTQVSLDQHTQQLVRALGRSEFRGKWGEAQLRRVVEAAGLVNGVHFSEQRTLRTVDGPDRRPDMVITLSDQRTIVIDAKVSVDALLENHDSATGDTTPDPRKEHALAIARHIDGLANKEYWRQFERSPEFVVLFLPTENMLGDAMSADPGLFERASGKNIVLATPSTLLAMLKAVALGWREVNLADNTRAIHAAGTELHERLSTFAGHLTSIGNGLDRAVKSYNDAIGSYDSRVLPSAQRMADLGVPSNVPTEVSLREITNRRPMRVAPLASGDD